MFNQVEWCQMVRKAYKAGWNKIAVEMVDVDVDGGGDGGEDWDDDVGDAIQYG